MAILTETPPLPYELLFRWDEVTGALKGAHFQTIVTVLRDGVAIAATPSDPMPVALVPGAPGEALADVLGKLATSQQARIVELEAALASATADAAKAVNIAEAAAAAAHALKDEAEARAEGLEKERDQAVATIDEVHVRENEALVKAKEAEAALVAEQDAHAETKATLEAAAEPVKE